jgi:FAD-linked oxidoreductase
MQNWSGNVRWTPREVFRPGDEEEIISLVGRAGADNRRIRTIGSGHSFTPLCVTEDYLVSLDNYQGISHIDRETGWVTVKAGTKLHTLNALLAAEGLALENLGDIDAQSIAGAISTGTHGTGLGYGNLATQVRRLRFVDGRGRVVTCSRTEQPEVFRAAVLSLGALGILTEITLECVPSYNLALHIRRRPLDEVLAQCDRYNADNRHFEYYWFPHTPYVMTKAVNPTAAPAAAPSRADHLQEVWLENYALLAICELSYRLPRLTRGLSRFAARTVTDYRKVRRSDQVFATRRLVRFNEMEYNVPLAAYAEVKRELVRWVDRHYPDILFPVENRFVQGDDLFLSPAYGRDSAYIAVHAYHKKDFRSYFRDLEAIFRAYDGRPHWGKLHTLTGETLVDLYPAFDRFEAIRRHYDPEGRFANPHLASIFST